MTTPVSYQPGDTVACLDDSQGANFLRRGRLYEVDAVQVDDAGCMRLCLVGMAAAWECDRFRPAGELE